jgi:hypothetical protein
MQSMNRVQRIINHSITGLGRSWFDRHQVYTGSWREAPSRAGLWLCKESILVGLEEELPGRTRKVLPEADRTGFFAKVPTGITLALVMADRATIRTADCQGCCIFVIIMSSDVCAQELSRQVFFLVLVSRPKPSLVFSYSSSAALIQGLRLSCLVLFLTVIISIVSPKTAPET